MDLNFGKLANTQGISTGSRYLKPWTITKVKFMGCKVDEIQGKKDPTAVYKILVTRFEEASGEDNPRFYEEKTFFPKDTDAKRPVFESNKGSYEAPSNFEQLMAFVAQLGTVLNPAGFKKMQEISNKFRSFDDVANALIKITEPAKGKEFYLKLVGKTKDGRTTAVLPRIVALNKSGEVFTSDNFISDKEGFLAFSDYDEGKRQAYLAAKPTDMSKVDDKPKEIPEVQASGNKGSEDIDGIDDFDNLLD